MRHVRLTPSGASLFYGITWIEKMNFFYVPAGNWIMGPFVKENRYAKPRLADRSRSTNRGFKLCEYWLFRIIPYFSFYMAFHGISDPECRESEVQITSTSLSKHFASMFAYKKIRAQKSPEMVDAPEFSQAHLYRLVNMCCCNTIDIR